MSGLRYRRGEPDGGGGDALACGPVYPSFGHRRDHGREQPVGPARLLSGRYRENVWRPVGGGEMHYLAEVSGQQRGSSQLQLYGPVLGCPIESQSISLFHQALRFLVILLAGDGLFSLLKLFL